MCVRARVCMCMCACTHILSCVRVSLMTCMHYLLVYVHVHECVCMYICTRTLLSGPVTLNVLYENVRYIALSVCVFHYFTTLLFNAMVQALASAAASSTLSSHTGSVKPMH